jgi:hypothetical protein
MLWSILLRTSTGCRCLLRRDEKLSFRSHPLMQAFGMQDELGEYEDDYYIFDCPGQIEL